VIDGRAGGGSAAGGAALGRTRFRGGADLQEGRHDRVERYLQGHFVLSGAEIGRRARLDPGADASPRENDPALFGGGHHFSDRQIALGTIEAQVGNFLPDGFGPLRGNFCH